MSRKLPDRKDQITYLLSCQTWTTIPDMAEKLHSASASVWMYVRTHSDLFFTEFKKGKPKIRVRSRYKIEEVKEAVVIDEVTKVNGEKARFICARFYWHCPNLGHEISQRINPKDILVGITDGNGSFEPLSSLSAEAGVKCKCGSTHKVEIS